jgi:hypothetical protein
MKILSRVIPKAESMPLFATHRSMFDTFSVGEKVFTVVIEDGYFSPVTITAIEYENIYVRFDKYEGKPSGKIEYDSPLLQKPDDLKYLIEHLDYARFYACACGLTYADDADLFVAMLEDFAPRHALYMDMGAGWNHSWYRKADGTVHEIHPTDFKSQYCTNWITFYETSPNPSEGGG